MDPTELTAAQEQALDANNGIVQGDSFVLMRTAVFRDLLGFESDQALRRQLQVGFDQAERQQWVDWDPERIKAEGRRRLQRRPDPT